MSHAGRADEPAIAGGTVDAGRKATIRKPSAEASAGAVRTFMYSSTGSVVGRKRFRRRYAGRWLLNGRRANRE
jgi:hypothetical protein